MSAHPDPTSGRGPGGLRMLRLPGATLGPVHDGLPAVLGIDARDLAFPEQAVCVEPVQEARAVVGRDASRSGRGGDVEAALLDYQLEHQA